METGKKPFDYFSKIMDEEMISNLTICSNEYFSKNYSYDETKIYKRDSLCFTYSKSKITEQEIKKFFAVSMIMGLNKIPEKELYWSKKPLYTNIIPKIISRNRYRLLNAAFKLENVDISEITDRKDKSFSKIKSFIENLQKKFLNLYPLETKLTIDEALVFFRGRSEMIFYIPKKPHKWGFKIHILAASESSYCYKFYFDKGNSENCKTLNIIKQLSFDIPSGHHIYLDNWYNSSDVSNYLILKGINLTGTINLNRKGLNKDYIDVSDNIKINITNENFNLFQYKDKRTVNILSTMGYETEYVYNDKTGKTRPDFINDYVMNMRGVDRINQNAYYYKNKFRSIKWWKRVFFYLLEVVMNNSFILFTKENQNVRMSRLKFREDIIESLLDSTKIYEENLLTRTLYKVNLQKPIMNIEKIHNLMKIGKKNKRGRCKFCSKPIKYVCKECSDEKKENLFLHPECFTKFHLERKIYL